MLIPAILLLVVLLTHIENRVINFGPDFPISNTILMFSLINLNLLLLLLLIFLVFRNLAKLVYDRRMRVMGARLRTRLVLVFVCLTLVPTGVLFFFSIHFITSGMELWFNMPVEQALSNSLEVGQKLYERIENRHRFCLERIAQQIGAKKLMISDKSQGMAKYVQAAQQEFDLNAIEVYGREARQITFSLAQDMKDLPLKPLDSDQLLRQIKDVPFRAFLEETAIGELSRGVSAIPFGTGADRAQGYLVVSTLIPSSLTENLTAISRGYEEYQQIKLLKRPIQITYYITLSIVALLVIFCAIWFGFYLAKTISIPIQELAEGTRRVAGGDLDFHLSMVGDDEIGSLVAAFNRMTQDLRQSRDRLEDSARRLGEQSKENEARRRYMEIVLQNVSTGVISLDAQGLIATVNTSAEKMLGIRAEEILCKPYRDLLPGPYLEMAEAMTERLASSGKPAIRMSVKASVRGKPRSFIVNMNILTDEVGDHIGLVAVFDDLTEQEKAQRIAAWREVARRIAHEVKNPLTPINLSAQRLMRKYGPRINDPVFEECTRMIMDQVELIRNLVNEFSRFARFPTANLERCRLRPVIEETVALYGDGHPEIQFDLYLPDEEIFLDLDRFQIKQAFINLLDNAIAAMNQKGCITLRVSPDPENGKLRIEVGDTGPGISEEVKARLFEPYFSTKTEGMGLGLTIVNTIIADHKGSIRVTDNPPHGTKFIIELPA